MIRILFLRAVNVGGAKLPMAELRRLLGELGATKVNTYIQSGNVVCEPPGDPTDFDRDLEAAIESEFGFFREVMSRSPAQVQAARNNHPFDIVEPSRSFISFLSEAPTPEAIARAQEFKTGHDLWEVIGREWHIRYLHGAGKPEMKTPSIGRALGVPGTARNINTVVKMIELANI